mmetsp:Transcript_38720/g.123015  ORF Transcript_38720/g.123015 Transcript_38720/m.123015 type:complete len:157 (+) Transcript_38720:286-756(+)
MWPAVVLRPDFAPCLTELRRKLGATVAGGGIGPGALCIASGSSLDVQGRDVRIDALDLEGALAIRVTAGASLHVPALVVRNRGHEFVALSEEEQQSNAVPEDLRIRGYRLVRHETKVIVVDQPGSWTLASDGSLQRKGARCSNGSSRSWPCCPCIA